MQRLDFQKLFAAMETILSLLPAAFQTAAWPIVLAATFKCAQSHSLGWLIQAAETLTPVPAEMCILHSLGVQDRRRPADRGD